MKKLIHILQGIMILIVILVAGLLAIKFIYEIRHEEMDTKYMWDISLNNLNVKEGSKEAEISIIDNILNLDVVLESEEEFYEFTFDIENKGTLDAELKNFNSVVQNPKGILTFEISYINNEKIKKGDVISSNSKDTVLVKIKYPKQKKKVYEALELKLSLTLEYTAIYK